MLENLAEAENGEKKTKYGKGLIKEYAKRLTKELGKGYTYTALFRMKKFYLISQKVATMSQPLTWSHYVELLSINDFNKINYYLKLALNQNLSVRELREKIKTNDYERLDNNTKNKLIKEEKYEVTDFIKNPILIKNNYSYNNINEKILKRLILEDLDNFLKELGDGFSYIGNEYKIKLGDRYNYIDLLLFNIKYNCYVIIELKINELKAEYIGQIQKYMNYIDKNLKSFNQDNTIGIIICKKDKQSLPKRNHLLKQQICFV